MVSVSPTFTWKRILLLLSAAISIRIMVFYAYIQYEDRYRQADSMDYHNSALGLSWGNGMHRPDTHKPIFWRTPGYPLFISFFYDMYGLRNGEFKANVPAQKAALIVQIILSSFIVLLVASLTFLLTSSSLLSWINGWVFAIHPGFVLASCYLLTEALAMLFFFFFLICFCKNIIHKEYVVNNTILGYACAGAVSLALYTWMRPNGQFVAFVALFLMFFNKVGWKSKVINCSCFILLFFSLIGGWCVRNYNLTGSWFFCPMSGPYLVSFSAPKIVRRVINKPLETCIKLLCWQVQEEVKKAEEFQRLLPEPKAVSQELLCSKIALPWLYEYPWYCLQDWLKEVIKTTFDLYSSQLVAFANNSYMYDPLEEFLSEKLSLCLYAQPMPYWMRLICWAEAFYTILLWLGILIGLWIFLIIPFWDVVRKKSKIDYSTIVWFKIWFLIGALLFMTGGFGYARLRMPVEPLLVIFSLQAWYWIIYTRRQRKGYADGLSVCAVA